MLKGEFPKDIQSPQEESQQNEIIEDKTHKSKEQKKEKPEARCSCNCCLKEEQRRSSK